MAFLCASQFPQFSQLCNFDNFAISSWVLRFVILALCDRHKHTYLIACLDIMWHFVTSCDIFWHRCGCHIKKSRLWHLELNDYIYMYLHKEYITRKIYEKIGSNWSELVLTRPNWPKRTKSWSELDRKGFNWSRVARTNRNQFWKYFVNS